MIAPPLAGLTQTIGHPAPVNRDFQGEGSALLGETVVNLPMVAEMVKASPLGREVALWRMRGCLSAQHFGRLRCLVAGVGDE